MAIPPASVVRLVGAWTVGAVTWMTNMFEGVAER
jgi:hypothetical protein